MAEQVLAEARRYDLPALGPPGREVRRAPVTVARRAFVEQAPCPVILLQGAGAAGRPVAVVYDSSERSLALGERLARITAARRSRFTSNRDNQRVVCDLPQPVRTAEIAITGTFARNIVRRGPRSTKSAPVDRAIEALCMTSA